MILKKSKILIFMLSAILILSLTSCEFMNGLLGNGWTTTSPEEVTEAPEESKKADETTKPVQSETIGTPEIVMNYKNPLTGLPTELDYSAQRALAFVVDNHYFSFPQSGLSKVDVLCEFIKKDGTTSMLAIVKNPENASLVGPLGVANSTMLDFAEGFDAIVFARNASERVKNSLEARPRPLYTYETNKTPFGFFESADRRNEYGYAYSVMGEGVRLLSAVGTMGERVTSGEGFSKIFNIYEGEEEYVMPGGNSENVYIPATESQHIQLVYSASEKMYYRFAFGTNQQVDAANGDAVAFKNIFLISGNEEDPSLTASDGEEIPLTVGSRGEGYFVSMGKFFKISWVKASDGSFRFYNDNGTDFQIPAGSIYISYLTKSQLSSVDLNYKR